MLHDTNLLYMVSTTALIAKSVMKIVSVSKTANTSHRCILQLHYLCDSIPPAAKRRETSPKKMIFRQKSLLSAFFMIGLSGYNSDAEERSH